MKSGNSLVNKMYPLYLALPGYLIYLLFFILPFAFTLYYSFTVWDYFSAKFIGFDNYVVLFTDKSALKALFNTVIFTAITVVVQTSAGMILALLFNKELRLVNFLRTLSFMPIILNTVAVGILMSAMLQYDTGPFNNLLRLIGLGSLAKDWLGDGNLAIYSVIFINTWRSVGYAMVILLAGLQMVPKEYYEAADIDGCNSWQKFKGVTIPLIMPSINNIVVLTIIGCLKVFDIVMVTTGGGPYDSSQVMNTYILKSYTNVLYGLASAQSIILSIIVIGVSVTAYLLIRRKEVSQ
jgi:raffinose/stachyose/melibiose transport system permease protein